MYLPNLEGCKKSSINSLVANKIEKITSTSSTDVKRRLN